MVLFNDIVEYYGESSDGARVFGKLGAWIYSGLALWIGEPVTVGAVLAGIEVLNFIVWRKKIKSGEINELAEGIMDRRQELEKQ